MRADSGLRGDAPYSAFGGQTGHPTWLVITPHSSLAVFRKAHLVVGNDNFEFFLPSANGGPEMKGAFSPFYRTLIAGNNDFNISVLTLLEFQVYPEYIRMRIEVKQPYQNTLGFPPGGPDA